MREDVPRDIVAELKQHTDELAGRRRRGRARSASIRTRSSARTCSATSPRSTPRRSRSTGPPGYEELSARGAAAAEPARLRGGRQRRARPASSTPGSPTCAGSAAGRSASSTRAGGTAPAPRPSASSTPPRKQEPIPGRDLRLTVDIELEQAIERAMRPHAAGAVVVVDVRTGRLLALYSKPDFDPNDLSGGAGTRARARGVHPALRRSAAADARQDDERRVPAGLDVQAVQRPGRARGQPRRPRAHREVRGVRHLRPPHLPLQPRARQGATCTRPSRGRATSTSSTSPRRSGMDRIARDRAGVRARAEDRARHQPRGAGAHPDALVVRAPLPRASSGSASR